MYVAPNRKIGYTVIIELEVVMSVLVVDKNYLPLIPCTEKRARLLLERDRTRIHCEDPFTIRLIDRKQSSCELQNDTLNANLSVPVRKISEIQSLKKSIRVF